MVSGPRPLLDNTANECPTSTNAPPGPHPLLQSTQPGLSFKVDAYYDASNVALCFGPADMLVYEQPGEIGVSLGLS